MKRKLLLVVLAAALLGAASPAWGDFYVIAVPAGVGTPITSLPYTITQPGFYYLKGNLTSTGNGIVIQASDVTLDLMGFCISGSGTHIGISLAYTYENIEVRNGTVRNFYYGIVSDGYACRIINIRAEHNNATGIYFHRAGALIKGCNASFNAHHGFKVDNSCNIIDNVAKGNTESGFYLGGGPLQLVDRNIASENGTNWTGLSGCTKGLNTP